MCFVGQAFDDFTYTPGFQTASMTVSDTSLAWNAPLNVNDAYTANGLNQYTDVGGASVTYDANGNITTDHRGWDYTYAADNRLTSIKDAGGASLGSFAYYADGNLRTSYAKRYYYDGDQEIAEYDSAWPLSGGTLQRRYIRLPGSIDEPILMIDYTLNGACTNTSYAACEVWSHQDRLGSVVATSDSLGNKLDTYTYSPYGESGPEGDAGFPFRFTGQKLDATTGLYYYKARFYDPEVGRFLQTDPIGYGDGMNMYAYVGGDPVNGRDPTGQFGLPGAAAGALIGGFVGGVVAGGAEIFRQQREFGGVRSINQVFVAAGGGAAAGALTGFVAGSGAGAAALLVGALSNGLASGTVNVINQSIAINAGLADPGKTQVDPKLGIQAAFVGFVGGLVPVPGGGVAGSLLAGGLVQNTLNGTINGRKRRNRQRERNNRDRNNQDRNAGRRKVTVIIEDQLTFDPDLLARGFYENVINQWLRELSFFRGVGGGRLGSAIIEDRKDD